VFNKQKYTPLVHKPSQTVELITRKRDNLDDRELIVKVDYYNADLGLLESGVDLIETNGHTSHIVRINQSECRKLYEILGGIFKRLEDAE
jgi:hypothetical protein